MKQKYGDIVSFPSMFGGPKILVSFNAEDAAKLYRYEGKFPLRRTFILLDQTRREVRPDVYGEYGSLLSE